MFINSSHQQAARKLDFTVIGRIKETLIPKEVAIICRCESTLIPVIIFSNNGEELRKLIPEAIIFEGEAGEQLSMLTAFRS